MEFEDKIFNEKYEKTLELANKINPKMVKKIYEILNSMPGAIKRNIYKEKSCSLEGVEDEMELDMEGCMMEFKHTNMLQDLETYVYVYPYYRAELKEMSEDKEDGEHSMLIASITKTNTDDEVFLKLFYNQKGNEIEFNRMEIPNGKYELDYSIYLDIEDGKYFLNYVASFNDLELKNVKKQVEYNELIEYACDKYDEVDLYNNNEDDCLTDSDYGEEY